MVGIRKKTGTDHPDDPGRDADDQQETDVRWFLKIFFDMDRLDGEEGDKEYEKENIEKIKDVLLSIKLTRRHQDQPLDADSYLDKDREEEEKDLVDDWKVHTGIERDEEHLLDHDWWVDENIGETRAQPDCHTGRSTRLKSIGKP